MRLHPERRRPTPRFDGCPRGMPGTRRSAMLGTAAVGVGSDQPLNRAMGFVPLSRTDLWVQDLER